MFPKPSLSMRNQIALKLTVILDDGFLHTWINCKQIVVISKKIVMAAAKYCPFNCIREKVEGKSVAASML